MEPVATEVAQEAQPVATETEQAATEQPKPEAKPEPVKDPKFDSRFAALSRREKEIVARESAAKERLSRLEAWEKEQEELKGDPMKVLNKYGLSYDQLTRLVLSDGKPDPLEKVTELEKRIESLKEDRQKEAEEAKKAELAANEKHVTTIIEAYKKETNAFVESNAEKYELIFANDAQGDVFSVIEQYFVETGETLTPEQAADYLEGYYEEHARKLLSTKKFAAQQKPAEEKKEQLKQEAPKTLTNARTVPVSSGHEQRVATSEKERLERAMALLNYKR